MSEKAFVEPDFKAIFEGLPGLYMVLDPGLRVVAASDAYLQATLTQREGIIGRHVFDVFPDNPEDPSADAVRNSLASFNRVLQSGVTDAMVVQRHDVRMPETECGGFEERYWSPVNSPLLNPDGSVAYIIHRVEDVTEFVRQRQQDAELAKVSDELLEHAVQMEADLYSRSREVAEANLKLKQANEGQAKLLDLAHVLIRDSHDRIISWNAGAETLYGFSKEEAIGRVSHDLLRTVFPVSKEAVAESLATAGRWQGELIHTAKDGHKVVVASHQILHRDEDGQPFAIIEVNNDVTEQKRVEQALRDSEDRLGFALATSHTGAWDLDLVDHTAYRSPEHDHIFGYEELLPEWTYQMFLEHVLPQDRDEVDAEFQHAVRTHSDWSFECRIRRADGEVRWIWAAGRHRRDSAGGVRRMAGSVQDITEVKQAEKELGETRDYLENLINYANAPIIVWDPDSRITRFNRAFERLTGQTADEMIGKDLSVLFPEATRDDSLSEIERTLAGERWESVEIPILRKDGEVRVALWNSASIHGDDGKTLLATIAQGQDITERKRAEETLRQSEERYRVLFDTLIEGFCTIEMVFDEDGRPVDYRFLELNPAFEEQTGLDNARGKLMRDLAPDHEEHWFEMYGRVALTGEAVRFENEAKALGRHFDVSAYRVGGADSRKVAILFSDITDRKQAEEALRESEERFRTMADAITQLAWIANPDGFIFWYNQRWYEYTGTTPEEMEGWGWQSVHDPEMLPKVLDRWKASIAAGEPFDMEFPLRGADGKFRCFLTRGVPVKDSEGRVQRWFGTNTDVSDARELEAHKREFYHRTILAATEGKLLISEADEIQKTAGPAFASWDVRNADEAASATSAITQLAREAGMAEQRSYDFLGCVTEAITNVLKHAYEGRVSLHRVGDRLICVILDSGPGIGAMALPDVALTRNYSTAGTLGMGYKLMIHFADKVYLATGHEGTAVAIEMGLHKDTVQTPGILSVMGRAGAIDA